LIEHWTGKKWRIVAAPRVPGAQTGNAGLNSIAAVSANDIWAVGGYDDAGNKAHSIVEHWNGRRWAVVPSPDQRSILTSVAAASSSDIWVGGQLLERRQGSRWVDTGPVTGMSGAFGAGPFSVSASSSRNVWAVDSLSNVGQWKGGQWLGISTSTLQYSPVTFIAATRNGQAVGTADNNSCGNAYLRCTANCSVELWNGNNWSTEWTGNSGTLNGIFVDAQNDAWAFGSDGQHGLMVHWDGSSWNQVPFAT
jgi:hypothetical protein